MENNELYDILKENFSEINKNFSEINKNFQKIDEKFEKIDEKFNKMDKRFDKMDERLDKMDERFNKVDERLDPLKSTKAAAKYLSELKEQFGKWYLALIAYNCGDGALRKAIARAGSDDIKDLLDPNKKFVGLETRNFLRKIIITAQIANDLNQIMVSDPRLFNNPKDINIAKINVKDAFKNSAIQKIKSTKK